MVIYKIISTLFIFLFLEGCVTEKTLLQIQGTVTDSTDSSTIAGAVIQLELTPIELEPGSGGIPTIIADAVTDENGFYYLKYLKKGNCKAVEDHFIITAMKTGQGYVYISETKYHVIRCTEEIQTVDFQLRRQ